MMERRELFRIFAATLVAVREGSAQHTHGPSAGVDIAKYTPRFFSDQQYSVIDDLTEIIIPADSESPSAHAAGVRFYIDTVLHYAQPETQEQWRAGLAAVEKTAQEQYGRGCTECSAAEKAELVALMARNEKAPTTNLERFFLVLKNMTLDAFIVSEIGMKEYLGYKGNTAIQEFPGCTHPEHQRF